MMRRYWISIAVVAGTPVAFALLSTLVFLGGLDSWDVRLLSAAGHLRVAPLDWLVLRVTDLGAWFVLAPLTVIAVVALLLARRRPAAALVAVVVIGAQILQVTLKAAFGRPRPEITVPLEHVTSAAYPSGHATVSCALALALCIVFWRARSRRPSGGHGPRSPCPWSTSQALRTRVDTPRSPARSRSRCASCSGARAHGGLRAATARDHRAPGARHKRCVPEWTRHGLLRARARAVHRVLARALTVSGRRDRRRVRPRGRFLACLSGRALPLRRACRLAGGGRLGGRGRLDHLCLLGQRMHVGGRSARQALSPGMALLLARPCLAAAAPLMIAEVESRQY